MHNLYLFFRGNLGAISRATTQLYWNGDYQACHDLLQIYANQLGSILHLGLNSLLIYNYTKYKLGYEPIDYSEFPAAPTREEIEFLYGFESRRWQRFAMLEHFRIRSSVLQGTPIDFGKPLWLAKLGIASNCDGFIETGTYLGETTFLLHECFKELDTIEGDASLYHATMGWLIPISRGKVRCHHGDSREFLNRILLEKTTKQLIYLDAHWSGGPTTREFGLCPLIEELDAIFKSKVDCTVCIDDMRLMGSNGYPSIETILRLIPDGRKATLQWDTLIIESAYC